MSPNADIFLSYAHADKSAAKLLSSALEELGWIVWWDHKIPPGKTWADVIEAALKASRCVIVIWSKSSVTSQWVKKEARHAESRQCLIPVRIETVEIPFEFEHLHASNLIDWKGERTDALIFLLDELQARLKASIPESTPTAPDPILSLPSLRSLNPDPQRSAEKHEISSLFPLYGVVLGSTTVDQLSNVGFRTKLINTSTGKPFPCFDVSDVSVSYDEETKLASSIYLVESEEFPVPWQELGMDWNLSYADWLKLLASLGYTISVTLEPHVVQFDGHDSLCAEVTGRMQGQFPHKIELDFNYSDNSSILSARTLYGFRACNLLEGEDDDIEVSNELPDVLPIFGVVLGKTTTDQLAQLGTSTTDIDGETGRPYPCYTINGFNFWYSEKAGVAEYIYLVHGERFPDKWKQIGFDWSMSYNAWITFLGKIGYSVYISEAPRVETIDSQEMFFAKVIGERCARFAHNIELEFKYRAGSSVHSKETLFLVRLFYPC